LSGTSGSRTGAYSGTLGGFSGSLNLYSPGYLFPDSGTLASPVLLEGVVGTSQLGASFGAASLSVTTPYLSLTVPGNVAVSPGGTFFSAAPVFVQSGMPAPMQVVGYNLLFQSPVFSFSENLQGFRISTTTGSANLSNIEGYGWGLRTSSNIPSSYLGYFVSQDLGTRASATPMSSNWLGVNGTLSGSLSGTLGSTLAGQGTFTGTNSAGTSFTYQGVVSLTPTGQLTFNYSGSWNNGAQSGTGAGIMQQVPGTPFIETASGTFSQTSTAQPLGSNYPTGSNLNVTTFSNTASLSGTRIIDPVSMNPSGANTTTTTFSSLAGMGAQVSLTSPPPNYTGPGTATIQGVVAGPTWQSQWGVATATLGGSLGSSVSLTGPVTIDNTNGMLAGQFVDRVGSGPGATDVSLNVISVPTASGLTTTPFTYTASGGFSQLANGDGSAKTVTTPTPLTGSGTGALSGGSLSANMAITSTAMQPGSYTSGTGTMAVTGVGVVGGTPGGSQYGVSSVQAVTTASGASGGSSTPTFVGSSTLTPGSATTPTFLNTFLTGVNSVRNSGVGATQTGGITVTK
jgi:hypothetical protein